MRKILITLICLICSALIISGCSLGQGNKSQSTIEIKTIDQLSAQINQIAARYGDSNPEIIKTNKLNTDGPTQEPMYIVFLKGEFTKGSLKASNLSLSILADGSKAWGIRAFDDNNKDVWLDNQ